MLLGSFMPDAFFGILLIFILEETMKNTIKNQVRKMSAKTKAAQKHALSFISKAGRPPVSKTGRKVLIIISTAYENLKEENAFD